MYPHEYLNLPIFCYSDYVTPPVRRSHLRSAKSLQLRQPGDSRDTPSAAMDAMGRPSLSFPTRRW